jgi:LacI family transcriptional regulator
MRIQRAYDLGVIETEREPLILIREHAHQSYAEILKRESEKYGWRLFNVAAARELIPPNVRPIGAILTWGATDALSEALKNKKVPSVRVGSFPEHTIEGMSSVVVDLAENGRMAAKFYADRGFSHLAFIGNNPWGDRKIIYDHYLETGERMGCKVHLFQFQSVTSSKYTSDEDWFSSQAKELGEWLKPLPKPLGLLTSSERMASRFCAYMMAEGIRVPEEVAILSVGNHPLFTETAVVPISSIDLPWEEMLERAFSYLKGLIGRREREGVKHMVTPKKIVERRSTDILVVDDPLVVQGLRFIWDNFERNISVEDFLSLTQVSRSTLQRAFKSCLQRGFSEELRRKRLEVAERILLNSENSVGKIAEEVGFNTLNYFHKVFLEEYGMTPKAYRKSKRFLDG